MQSFERSRERGTETARERATNERERREGSEKTRVAEMLFHTFRLEAVVIQGFNSKRSRWRRRYLRAWRRRREVLRAFLFCLLLTMMQFWPFVAMS